MSGSHEYPVERLKRAVSKANELLDMRILPDALQDMLYYWTLESIGALPEGTVEEDSDRAQGEQSSSEVNRHGNRRDGDE